MQTQPPSWANYLKIMQFFTRNWVYTPNCGLKIRIFLRFASPSHPHPPAFVKTLQFATPFLRTVSVQTFCTFKVLSDTYCTRRLHPWLTIYLHGKPLSCSKSNHKTSTRMSDRPKENLLFFFKHRNYQWTSLWENLSYAICEQQRCADQPAHPRILISIFVVCCQDSTRAGV